LTGAVLRQAGIIPPTCRLQRRHDHAPRYGCATPRADGALNTHHAHPAAPVALCPHFSYAAIRGGPVELGNAAVPYSGNPPPTPRRGVLGPRAGAGHLAQFADNCRWSFRSARKRCTESSS
jgi:hypothetical protein